MSHDAIVVGSGPAGVAAAAALLRRGRRVLMLDAGIRLEPERQELVARMAQVEPAAWTSEELAAIRQGMEPKIDGIPLKRLFGSDFSFRNAEQFAEIVCHESDPKMSLAFGGLSNVWGAGAIPFCAEDISDWPLGIADLAPFYRECLEELELAAVADDLATDYPLYTERNRALQPSRQATALLDDLGKHRAALRREGISFGHSRLAVTAQGRTGARGCVYCGLCLYGCPYGFIYNSAERVREMLSDSKFQYQANVVIDHLEESNGHARLDGHDPGSGAKLQFAAGQVFLACGPIPTTALLLESLGAWDTPVEMKDSQYFIFPALRFRSTPEVESERLHTLAQVFLEIRDPNLSTRGIHLSIYSYNDLLPTALKIQTGLAGRMAPALPQALARRLLVFGGYLHSRESPAIEVTLTRSPRGKRLQLRGLARPASAKIVKKLMQKLVRNSLRLKAIPLTPLVRPGLPGRGFHSGGTFPMATNPGKLQSDLFGRPHGFSRVHVVDATVFPSIPAPNLTLSVMANARRIAAAACEK